MEVEGLNIEIKDAYEKNLKHIDLEIPRGKFVVISGLSGSGKTTLMKDTLFNEAQRQYLEALGMQGIQKPGVVHIGNLSPAVLIDQEGRNQNPRSTLGTQTDIYTDLRMIFEKIHTRQCPHCHSTINAADAKEETEKIDGKFMVYMECPECHQRMDKLTRTNFSFNTRDGACPVCHGFGTVMTIQENIYDKEKSLEDNGVRIWQGAYADYQAKSFYGLLRSLGEPVPEKVPLGEYTPRQWTLLKHGVHESTLTDEERMKIPKQVNQGHFDGLETKVWEKIAEQKGIPDGLKNFIGNTTCSSCHGEKLNELSRKAEVFGARLPVIEQWSLRHLMSWLEELKPQLTVCQLPLIKNYLLDLETKIKRLRQVGLDYLSLDRQYLTLSGGEAQRVKLSAVLDSEMVGLIYMLDEPTIGLHPKDTEGLINMIHRLRDLGNTVLVIEHDEEVMKQADEIIEMGPKAGIYGGEVIAQGTYNQLLKQADSLIAQAATEKFSQESRRRDTSTVAVEVTKGEAHNLKVNDLRIPADCLTVITGVSGSGKSSLVFDELAISDLQSSEHINWRYPFSKMVTIDQKRPARNKRSLIVTYIDLFSDIRKLFAKEAKQQGKHIKAGDFAFNSGNGRCPNCQGLGKVESNQLFFEDVEVTCPECQGTRYLPETLSVTVNGKNISEVLDLSVVEAADFFKELPVDTKTLELLEKTNLDYVLLGQGTDTLSGGEMQRLRLATTLAREKKNKILFILDEPTTGMHKIDIYYFMQLIQELIDAGNTFIFIEHNLDVIRQADYVVELGPGGGEYGGYVTFSGGIEEFLAADTVTSKYLRL